MNKPRRVSRRNLFGLRPKVERGFSLDAFYAARPAVPTEPVVVKIREDLRGPGHAVDVGTGRPRRKVNRS